MPAGHQPVMQRAADRARARAAGSPLATRRGTVFGTSGDCGSTVVKAKRPPGFSHRADPIDQRARQRARAPPARRSNRRDRSCRRANAMRRQIALDQRESARADRDPARTGWRASASIGRRRVEPVERASRCARPRSSGRCRSPDRARRSDGRIDRRPAEPVAPARDRADSVELFVAIAIACAHTRRHRARRHHAAAVKQVARRRRTRTSGKPAA